VSQSRPGPLDRIADAVTRRPSATHGAREPEERAAVCVVVRPGGDLLFMRRSERDGDPWSGHMAFPGGRMERGDASTRATAAREAHEEVGLDPEVGAYLGALDELESPPGSARRRLVITPHVWVLPGDPRLRLNHEVASVHWFSLDRLLSDEGRSTFSYAWRGRSVELPVVRLDEADIWGITLRILDDLLARIRA